MRGSLILSLVVIMLMSSGSPLFADGPADKAVRGVTNVVTSPLEVTKGIWEWWWGSEGKGIMGGLTIGLVTGTFNMIKRAAVGAYELATFPIPIPAGYEPIIEEPDFT